jgi:hypothetical protein
MAAGRTIEADELTRFRAGIRRRYSDEQILTELVNVGARLGRSPTMQEFRDDGRTGIHPQTVVVRFGSWNAAKRAAGLAPRRFATRDDLVAQLRALGDELGRLPRTRDIDARRGSMASKSLFWHTFGSLSTALREAGYRLPERHERLEEAVAHGAALARVLRRLPRFTDWRRARSDDAALPTEWQVYRLVGGGKGAWSTFQVLVRDRIMEEGGDVAADGRVVRLGRRAARASSPKRVRASAASQPQRARRGATGRNVARREHGRRGEAPR